MTVQPQVSPKWLKATLLTTSTMTIMSGAVISPALPAIRDAYEAIPDIDFFVRLLLTLPALLIAIGAPIVGMIIDRWGRKRYLVFSIFLYGIAGSAGLYLTDMYHLLISRALLGIAVSGTMTCGTTLAGDYFRGVERSSYLGMQSASIAGGGVIFLVAAGVLADVGWRMPFIIYLASFLVLPAVMMILYEPSPGHQHGMEHVEITALPQWTVFGIYVLAFSNLAIFYMIPVNLPFFLIDLVDANMTQVGVAIAFSTLSGALISTQYQKFRAKWTRDQVFIFVFFVMGLSYLALLISSNYIHVLMSMFIHGIGMGLVMPNMTSWLLDITPEAIRGRIVGGMSTAMYLGMFCSPMLIEPLRSITSLAGTYGIAGGILLIMMVIFTIKSFRSV